MNSHLTLRRLWSAMAAVAVLAFGGCLEKRLVWSPDGRHAAVIADDGLYLCDEEGRISGLLAPGVTRAAWLPDSQRLVVVCERRTTSWPEIAPALGEARASVEALAQACWRQIECGQSWDEATENLKGQKVVAKICLRGTHAEELQRRLGPGKWAELSVLAETIREIRVAKMEGDKLSLGPVLQCHANDIADLRPSPRAEVVAWTRENVMNKDEFETLVTSLADGSKTLLVAQRTAAYPDWKPDGRTLVYVEASNGPAGAKNDEIVLGVLTSRTVVSEDGSLVAQEKPEYLAGLLFNAITHVRCLRDGRVLFNAVEMSLPVAAADYGGDQREQLFAVDPGRQSTLVRLVPRSHEAELPPVLAFFEVSPDDRQLVVGGMKREVAVLTLATGEVTRLQGPAKDDLKGVPVWRRAGELTYVKRMETESGQSGAGRAVEFVLRHDDKETVLSRTWSAELLKKVTGGGGQ